MVTEDDEDAIEGIEGGTCRMPMWGVGTMITVENVNVVVGRTIAEESKQYNNRLFILTRCLSL
jgi:hypothetical protein